MKRTCGFVILPFVLTILFLLAAGCTGTPGYGTPTPTPTPITTVITPVPTTSPISTPTVMTASSVRGTILVDQKGMTLYYFANDVPGNGTSACSSAACNASWPPFFTDTLVVQAPLAATDFQTITRSGGLRQITYRGWPLYYYANDRVAGDVNGDAINNVWYTMAPAYTVVIMKNAGVGTYLADGQGKTLYVFTKDRTGVSVCNGSCIQAWPAFPSTAATVPSGLTRSDFTPVPRTDNITQSAYKGMPLYYYSGDSTPGETKGQGIGGVWFVAPLTALPSTTVTTPPTTIPTTVPTTAPYSGGY